jgi:hypothetical protein
MAIAKTRAMARRSRESAGLPDRMLSVMTVGGGAGNLSGADHWGEWTGISGQIAGMKSGDLLWRAERRS